MKMPHRFCDDLLDNMRRSGVSSRFSHGFGRPLEWRGMNLTWYLTATRYFCTISGEVFMRSTTAIYQFFYLDPDI
jgi:hypothetical protein